MLTEFDNGNLKLFSLTMVFFTSFQSNVGGESCGTCKPGFFNLQADNPQGCTPCFCNGVSDSCQSALLNRTQVNWDVDHVQIVITHAPTTFQATFQKYSYCRSAEKHGQFIICKCFTDFCHFWLPLKTNIISLWWNRELTLKCKHVTLPHELSRQSNGRSNPEVVGSIPTEVKIIFSLIYLVWFPDSLY